MEHFWIFGTWACFITTTNNNFQSTLPKMLETNRGLGDDLASEMGVKISVGCFSASGRVYSIRSWWPHSGISRDTKRIQFSAEP